MRTRKAVLVPLVLVTVLAITGAAYAAFNGRLKGKGSGQAIRIEWTDTPGTNDASTAVAPDGNDPTNFSMNPTRDTLNIGSTDVSLVGTPLALTVSHLGVYDGYKATVFGSGKVSGAGTNQFKVQRVRIVADGAAPIPSGLSAYLAPAACGLTLTSTGLGIQIGLGFTGETTPATFNYGLEVDIVPSAVYSAGSCNPWTP